MRLRKWCSGNDTQSVGSLSLAPAVAGGLQGLIMQGLQGSTEKSLRIGHQPDVIFCFLEFVSKSSVLGVCK